MVGFTISSALSKWPNTDNVSTLPGYIYFSKQPYLLRSMSYNMIYKVCQEGIPKMHVFYTYDGWYWSVISNHTSYVKYITHIYYEWKDWN